MNKIRQTLRTIIAILCIISISLTSHSQAICDGTLYIGEYCASFPGTTIIEGNNNFSLMYMEYNESTLPQGPYNVQVNGVYYENVHFFNDDPICCDFANPSDFNYDMDLPGTYTFTVQSIESLTNECVDNFNSPISVSTITVLPKPKFDISFTCLPSGAVQVDVILMSNIQFSGYIYMTGLGIFSPQDDFFGGSVGDILFSETVTFNPGQEYNIELKECSDDVLLLSETYTHNCTNCNDANPPTALCKNISLDLGGTVANISPVDLDNGSTDDCGIVSYGINFDEFDCSHIGQNQVSFTVADGSGNVSSCNSTVSITDNNNTCSQCGTIAQPIIVFSHTELLGSTTRIWLRITNINDYNSILNNIKFFFLNYIDDYQGFGGSSFSNFANYSVSNESDSLSEYVSFDVNFNSSFYDCPVPSISLQFHDNLCDISYASNRLSLSCDNDNDGFIITEDCNDFNSAQFDGAIEYCDGIDNDCNGVIDENCIDIFGSNCPFELNVSQVNIVPGTYNADQHIITTGTINQFSNVNYKAGNNIEMLPGFEVENGSVMQAYIAPCQ